VPGRSCPTRNAPGSSPFWQLSGSQPGGGHFTGRCLRKVRVAREGGGKSGGYRTIYVFGGNTMPLFLVTVFAKNEKGNLSPTEQAAAVALSKQLVATYGAAEGGKA